MNFVIVLLSKLPNIILLLLAATSVTFGDYFAKYWSQNQKWQFYIITLIAYLGSGFFYIPTLLKEGLVITSIIWSLLSIIGFLVVGLLIFHEKLAFWQTVGVALGLMSLLILTFTQK